MLRLLGLVYFFAFLGFVRQGLGLVGARGILPAQQFLERLVDASAGSRLDAFRRAPTLFLAFGAGDRALHAVGAVGCALSLALVLGATNAGLALCTWGLYLSLFHVGQDFYGFGWELQLLETGLLAVFLCPLRSIRPSQAPPPPVAVVWLFRWLIARIMLGAGLIKLRGDVCWTDLTCLDFHFETQPSPNPLSSTFHAAPHGVHAVGVAVNHVVELVLPLLAFGPRPARLVAGGGFLGFQCVLIASGNLSFLNWLTLVPALACLDDDALRRVLPKGACAWLGRAAGRASRGARIGAGVLVAVVAFLSVEPLQNLASPRQAMNRSYNPLRFVNTYGAFGGVTRERVELSLEGTDDPGAAGGWRAYELPCKPGPPDRRPCVLGPYHLRLDWQAWFLPLGESPGPRWLAALLERLFAHEASVRALFAVDPFPDAPPRCLRMSAWRYRFARRGEPGVWVREPLGTWLAPLCADDELFEGLLAAHGLARR